MKKIILFLSFFFTGLVSAQETTDINETIEKANAGDESAQFVLGTAYYLGLNGAEQDYEKAFYWWKKAAEQGNPDAQISMGFCYYGGKGIEQSNSKAFYWWKKAAEQGNPEAQVQLGLCYSGGIGVEKSKSKAIYWLRKACENFNDEACEFLNKINKNENY